MNRSNPFPLGIAPLDYERRPFEEPFTTRELQYIMGEIDDEEFIGEGEPVSNTLVSVYIGAAIGAWLIAGIVFAQWMRWI